MSSKRLKKRSKKKQPSTSTSAAAKSKSRKPRFMSLNNHLAPTTPQQPDTPEPVDDDNESQQVACLLEESAEPDGGATITHLFGNSPASSPSAVADEVLPPASTSVERDGEGLARRALRGRERWVFCRSSSEEVTQRRSVDAVWCGVQQGLQLKLDYEEILSAWSDRGSLYIDGEGPQVVPQLRRCSGLEDDSAAPSVLVEVGNGGGWRVPEMEVEGKERGGEGDKFNREERVMRYKAKRQSRLFAKRIRYEVRKLNAEKRPRIKGRFVKRVEDM